MQTEPLPLMQVVVYAYAVSLEDVLAALSRFSVIVYFSEKSL